MQLLARPNFFIVKISKAAQKERKGRQGSLFIVTGDKDEKRNLQCGEIFGIGSAAAELFPDAKVGQTLILHWLVESKEKDNKFWEDEEFNYYHVTAVECNGRPNEAYGVWDGEKIIPNPEYLFLEITQTESDIDLNKLTKETGIGVCRPMAETESGFLVFKEWKETRVEKEERMAKINNEIASLTKTKMSPGVAVGVARKEEELAIISNEINSKKIEFYVLAAISPLLNDEIEVSMGKRVEVGERVGCLNMATQTTIEFMGKEYIVCLSKHFYGTEYWIKSSIHNFKKKAAVETAA